MPNDAVGKPAAPTPIVDRFRLLLRERENDFRVSSGDDNGLVSVPPPSTKQIVRFYEDVLLELTFNSKPVITDLTIIAGEQREHGEGIADAICARVLEVSVEQKLPSLYLLDSIVKNIGREYVRHFAVHLPEVFCEAYRQVPPNLHPSMRHLFGTWLTVFPLSVLRKIEDELQFSPRMNQACSSLASMRASESPRPSYGIHVNLKYLEERRQSDNSSINNNTQFAIGAANLKTLGQKHSIMREDYGSDPGEVVISNTGVQRFSSYGGCTSFPLSADKLPPSVSGPGTPSLDEFAAFKSPGRIFENTSPLVPGYDCGRRTRGRDLEIGDWPKRLRSDDLHRGFENAASRSFSNGFDHDRPRALIDAYGHDDGQRALNEKPLGIDIRVVNCAVNNFAAQSWQNTEEEEFDWEDMNPASADPKTIDLTQPSSLPPGCSRAGTGLVPLCSTPWDASSRQTNWTTSSQMCRLEDSQKAVEVANLIQDSSRGSLNKSFAARNLINKITEYHHSQGACDPVQNLPGAGRESVSQLAFPASGGPSSFRDGKPFSVDDFAVVSNAAGAVVPVNQPAVAQVPAGVWPSTSANNMMPLPPLYPQQLRPPVDFMNPSYRVLNQGSQRFGNDDNRVLISAKPTQLHHPGFTPLHRPIRPPISVQQQFSLSRELRHSAVSTGAPLPRPMMRPPSSLGYAPLGHGAAATNVANNQISSVHSSIPFPNVSNGSSQFQAPVPLLPPVPHPPSLILPLPQGSGPLANQLPTIAVSGLINSLVAQGVLSLTKQTHAQESLGIEFNLDHLKVHHESSIRALYDDLPRQCTTCGLRFKTQEEHSKHMDWHVAKNRISKNRKHNPSQKWFVSASMWLTGTEAMGTDAAPGFLPVETVVEKQDDEEMAVPADEDQNTCALCGEPFEDFYSDETEEWMYRGAVYLNVPAGSVAGMDRSQLGPIVHAKCRSDSSAVPS